MRERAFPARFDGELKHRVEFVFGNDERLPPILVTLRTS
jgi:hypothetical protein